jgi:hypothetical protein
MNPIHVVCTCIISLELCPVHKKSPHVEVEPILHVRHVFDGVLAASTSSTPAGFGGNTLWPIIQTTSCRTN